MKSTPDNPFAGMSAAEVGALSHGELCAMVEDMAALIHRQEAAIAHLVNLLNAEGEHVLQENGELCRPCGRRRAL